MREENGRRRKKENEERGKEWEREIGKKKGKEMCFGA